MLLFKSFQKLNPIRSRASSNVEKFQKLFQAIGMIKKACSIGCGPGSDLLGLISFLKIYHGNYLEEIYMLDWAIEDWKYLLQPLRHELIPYYCKKINIGTCDITKGLGEEYNNNVIECCKNGVTFFCISYLLTEQRDKWITFVMDLFESACARSIFYFQEPLPWQLLLLQTLLESSHIEMDMLWLDSSMFTPHLQKLNRRNGAAVLVIVKKS